MQVTVEQRGSSVMSRKRVTQNLPRPQSEPWLACCPGDKKSGEGCQRGAQEAGLFPASRRPLRAGVHLCTTSIMKLELPQFPTARQAQKSCFRATEGPKQPIFLDEVFLFRTALLILPFRMYNGFQDTHGVVRSSPQFQSIFITTSLPQKTCIH